MQKRGSFLLVLEVLAMLAGAFALLVRPNAEWIESAYATAIGWQHLASASPQPFLFSLGDIVVVGASLGWLLVKSIRKPRLLPVAGADRRHGLWFEAAGAGT